MVKRVHIKTYGCQMNERDSEDVACKLKEKGYEIVDSEDVAEIILLNTCSIREQAEQKAIGKAGHLLSTKKLKKPLILGVIGCMAQNRGEQLLETLPGLDLVVGTQKFHRVPKILDEISSGNSFKKDSRVVLENEEGSQNEIKDHFLGNKKVSSFVSIMQGCNMKCSYCIVPKTRGKERYRSIDEILDEVKLLRDHGTKEVTLLGQIVNAYGRGVFPRINKKSPFVQLLEAINLVDGIERIRFTSPHPTSFGTDLIEAFGTMKKLGNYAHLPMQSGSDKILNSMNRPYTREKVLRIVHNLRSVNPSMRLSTDIIVGYPGEEQKDFELTKDAFKKANFEMAYIFKYSERKGTPSSEYPDKISQSIKESRNQELLKLLDKQSLRSNQKQIGSKMEVLVEGRARKGHNHVMGKTTCYRKVIFEAPKEVIGQLVMVRIINASQSTLMGELI